MHHDLAKQFKSFQRVFDWIQVWTLTGPFMSLIIFWIHSYTDLDLCFGSLFCWMVKCIFILSSLTENYLWLCGAKRSSLIAQCHASCRCSYDDKFYFSNKHMFYNYEQKKFYLAGVAGAERTYKVVGMW